MSNILAVSVIIPLYNAEKYIAETLESLLAQTFQNFEVIIADDCSTDSSTAIVKSYATKFGGRLKLTCTTKNSGSGAIPRNEGLTISSGEYVFNMDNDDLLTPTALEELYTFAKNFDADVVSCERYYSARSDLGEIYICDVYKGGVVNQATFASDDLTERVRGLVDEKFWVTPWSKLVRRDVLIDNEIFFPSVTIADDDIWTCEVLFSARKILCVPNAVYIWRQSEQSVMRRERTLQESLEFWLQPIIFGIKTLDDFMSKLEFFSRRPEYRCAVLEFFVHSKMAQVFNVSKELTLPEIYTAIKNSFASELGNHDVLISWLLADLIMQQKIFFDNRQHIAELETRLNDK